MLTHRFPLTLDGVNNSKVYFFQHGHVAYQIKGNDKCSNLQANILSLHSEISLISCFDINEQ